MLSRTGLFKEGETYPLFIWDEPINENDPVFNRAREEAVKSFNEHPWPEEVLKRIIKKED